MSWECGSLHCRFADKDLIASWQDTSREWLVIRYNANGTQEVVGRVRYLTDEIIPALRSK